MEPFSIIRRLPKRFVWCICFTCVMLLLSAFFVLYHESERTSVTTVQNVMVDDDLDLSGVNQNPRPSSKKTINGRNFKAVPPSISFQSKDIENGADHLKSRTTKNSTFVKQQQHSKIDTYYVYVTAPPPASRTSRTLRRITANIKTTTAPFTIPDTCYSNSTRDSKVILLWTGFFGYWKYMSNENLERCPSCRNCRVTTDRQKLNESDAVVFHCRDMSLADLPSVRHPHQKWAFYCLESPPYSDFPGLQYTKNMFNLTMTYRSDSDVITQYGSIIKIHPPRKLDIESLKRAFNKKSKSVVWMSSHCPTDGGRDQYVTELRKYIDVDTYGTCGDSQCPAGQTDSCMQDFAKRYKFFLAFENTICKDYITEKFYRTLMYDVIPVTFSGPKYGAFAPPSSFIDALSFKSPKHLAYFLQGVGKDFDLYSNYFKWRKNYSVKLINQKDCKLCSLLHRDSAKTSSYGNMRNWWVKESHCRAWSPQS